MRRSCGRGCWRWDQKEAGRGGDRRRRWPEEGGGEPGTVSARGDRCLGPRPSGPARQAPQGGPPDPRLPPSALPPTRSWPNSPHPVLRWGPRGLGKAAPRPPHSLSPNPLTYHSSSPGCQPLPTRPGDSTCASPQWPGGSGGQSRPEWGRQMGGAVGTERGRSREGASAGKRLAPPLAQASATLAGWVGPAWA